MVRENPTQRDALLESFASELTLAAYRVALRARAHESWLDLELDLWKALGDKVQKWGQDGFHAADQ